MAVAIRDLKIQYDKYGNIRANRADDQDNLYLYYKDKKEKIIIRDLFEQDATEWRKVVMRTHKLNPKERKQVEDNYKKEVRNREENASEYTLIVTNVSGKILGTIDVYPLEGEYKDSEVIVQISLRDQNTVNTMGQAVIKALQNLHQKYGWYDKVLSKDSKGDLVDLIN